MRRSSRAAAALLPVTLALCLTGCGGLTPIETSFNRAVYLYSAERYEEAAAEYRLALEDDEEDLRALYNYGLTLEHLGRREEAQAQYERVLSTEPNHPRASVTLAAIEWESGDADAAEGRLRSLIEHDASNLFAYATLAANLVRAGRLEESVAVIAKGLGEDGTSADLNALLGDVNLLQGDFVAADAAYENALKRAEEDLHALVGRGQVAFLTQRWTEARSWMQRALHVHPRIWRAHVTMARVAEIQDRFEDAAWHWWQARDLAHTKVGPFHNEVIDYNEQLRRVYRRLLEKAGG